MKAWSTRILLPLLIATWLLAPTIVSTGDKLIAGNSNDFSNAIVITTVIRR